LFSSKAISSGQTLVKESHLILCRSALMDTGTSLRRIYAGQRYPHVYTLSFSTGKNQSAEAQWSYTFQQKSISTKLSQRVIQYYRNITSPEITKVHDTERLHNKN